jgi:hypothetical protein
MSDTMKLKGKDQQELADELVAFKRRLALIIETFVINSNEIRKKNLPENEQAKESLLFEDKYYIIDKDEFQKFITRI